MMQTDADHSIENTTDLDQPTENMAVLDQATDNATEQDYLMDDAVEHDLSPIRLTPGPGSAPSIASTSHDHHRRMSLTSERNMSVRSIPIPKAKPE